MLKTEIKKLLSFKILWVLLACMLAFNGYAKITKAYSSIFYGPKEYTSYLSELDGMTVQEALDYSENKIENFDETEENPPGLLYDISEICKKLLDYPNYLSNISENAENLTSVSLWGGEDTYSYRNIEKTPSAYKNLKSQILPLDTSLGVEAFLDTPVTDWLIIVLLFICVCRIFLTDREQGMMKLLYSTQNGRGKLLLTKVATASICCIFLTLIFFTEIFFIENYLYGFGDLSRPIQAIWDYYTANLALTVGEYIGLYIIMKMASYLVFMAIFSLICTVSKNNLTVYGASAGVCGLCYILYSKISVLSPLSLLHYWNPVQFLNIKEIFGTYTNVNLFGYPVSLKISAIIIICTLLVALTALSCFIFCKTRNLQYKNFSISNKIHFKYRVHGRFYYTCKRILILEKGIIILVLVVLVTTGFCQTIKKYYDNDEIYYENFCTDYAGEINDDTKKFISEKIAFYEETEKEIAELESTDNPSYFELNKLYSSLNDKSAFERFENRVENIPETSSIFYDTGYSRYFGLDDNKDNILILLFIMISLVLMLSPVPSYDKKTNMTKIIYTTHSGKKGYFKSILCPSIVISVLVSLIVSVPYLLQILNKYGSTGISCSVNGIVEFANFPAFISVGIAMLLLVFIRIIFASFCGIAITLISSKCKGLTASYCINSVIFILPVVILLCVDI